MTKMLVPAAARVEKDGISYLSLPKLIELKLASGQTNPLLLKDIVDVQELISLLKLPAAFAEKLDLFVRAKYLELWTLIRDNPIAPEKDEALRASSRRWFFRR